ncbi:hypothetical protein A10D4_09129 [Idiomarina xiamenensis 10-D-4]|uniref:Uncharacterized protein n=2 Tax=Idiomarina xiamenensis TaxID=1207041 RepID=K2JHE6_9GAMM|nr:hypothetical protein A10D4_09129 [Idiomarina xiamenensis 10-D-4]
MVLLLVTIISALFMTTPSLQLSSQRHYRQSQLLQVIQALYRYRQQQRQWPSDLQVLNDWLPAPLSYASWHWRQQPEPVTSALHLRLPEQWPNQSDWAIYFKVVSDELGDWLVLPAQLSTTSVNQLAQLLPRDAEQSASMLTTLDLANHPISNSATVTAKRVRIEQARSDDLQVEQAKLAQLSFSQPATTIAIAADTVKINELQAIDVASQQLTAEQAEVQRVNAEAAQIAAVASEQLLAQALRSERGQVHALQAKQAELQRLISLYPLHGKQLDTPFSSVDENYRQLTELQQQMQRCMAADGWCQAPQTPTFSLTCEGCQQQQEGTDFSARLSIALAACVHGCDYQLSLPQGVHSDCPLNGRIAAVKSPALTAHCRLSGQLTLPTAIEGELVLTVKSGKKASAQRQRRLALHWQRSIQTCPAQRVSVTVLNSSPLQVLSAQMSAGNVGQLQNTGPLTFQCFPNAPGGDPIRRCSAIFRCQASGEWLRVSHRIRCACIVNEPHA